MSDLMVKLAAAKKIMEIHDRKPRQRGDDSIYEPTTQITEQQYVAPQPQYNLSQYNIPQEQEIKMPRQANKESIINSKLPDEIKRLMIENPIDIPTIASPVLSDDVIEGAARLMGTNKKEQVQEQIKSPTTPQISELKQMIRDVVRDSVRDVVREELQSVGLLTEKTQKANEIITIRVGSHIFEGTVNKIKKIK